MDFDRFADVLIGYSTAVRPGEVVSLLGPASAEPLLAALYRAVLQVGGHPLMLMKPDACEEWFYRLGNTDQLTFVDPLEAREVEVADAAVHVLRSVGYLAQVDPGRLALHQRARRPMIERFFQRTADGSLRWTATLFPGPETARAAGLTVTELENLFCQAAFLDQPDPVAAWRLQEQRQARLIASLQPVRTLRFVTPAGTDLRLGIAGRRWNNGAGRSNFPDGEIHTAPVEDATEGTVYVDFPTLYANQVVRGMRLVFRAGRVVEASAEEGENCLRLLLDQDAGAARIGEAALGCNYALSQPTGHPLLDEKIGGTFHLGLGAALPGSGGQNRSALHWDLIGDLRRGGRVEADGKVLSENGRFLDPTWPH